MDQVRQLVESRPDFFANKPAEPGQTAIKINDFIYASPGLSYAYLLVTPVGRIVINTGMGFEAPIHKQAFDAVCPGPTPYIILTQGHTDHVGGVHLFREAGTKLIAQRNNGACQRDDERIRDVRMHQASVWFREAIETTMRIMRETGGSVIQDIPMPDVLFDDRMELSFGGLKIVLISVPGGETVDSLVVWLPEHRIAFIGNMLGPLFPHFPNFNTIRGDRYRFFEPYLDSLCRLRALEPKMLLTGRFEPIVGADLIHACLDRLEGAVDYVHRSTLDGMNAGKDIWTLMREVTLPDHLFVGQGYGKVSWGVRTVWETYMGWFKAQATSELYPTQARQVHAELVALAGLEAAITLGRGMLTGGNVEASLHVAEAALANSPNDPAALRLALDVHRQLLDRSGEKNFWETGWLKHQISKFETTLAQL